MTNQLIKITAFVVTQMVVDSDGLRMHPHPQISSILTLKHQHCFSFGSIHGTTTIATNSIRRNS